MTKDVVHFGLFKVKLPEPSRTKSHFLVLNGSKIFDSLSNFARSLCVNFLAITTVNFLAKNFTNFSKFYFTISSMCDIRAPVLSIVTGSLKFVQKVLTFEFAQFIIHLNSGKSRSKKNSRKFVAITNWTNYNCFDQQRIVTHKIEQCQWVKIMYQYHLTKVSSNKKTGPIPVSTTSKDSCPKSCPFMGNGCYAESGPLAIHWRKITERERGTSFDTFLAEIKRLPKGQLWRHNQAGDLPHNNGKLCKSGIGELVSANKGKNGFTYTHHDIEKNWQLIEFANKNGFTVNVSGNNVAHAVSVYKKYNLPTVTVLPMSAPNVQFVDGVKIVACPAEKSERVNCANCKLCAIPGRSYIIGFRVHGTGKKKAEKISLMNIDN